MKNNTLLRSDRLVGALSVLLAMALASPALGGLNEYSGSGPDGGRASVVIIDPSDVSRVYAVGYGNGLFVSDDAGATWAPLDVDAPGITRTNISSMAVDPNAPSTLWVADGGAEVARSTDRGLTWTSSSTGFASGDNAFFVVADKVTVGKVFAWSTGELYLSTDNGDTWTNVADTLGPSAIDSLLQAPSDPAVFYVTSWDGVYRSSDGGVTWTARSGGLPVQSNGYVFATVGSIDPASPDTMLVNVSNNGNFRTTNGGVSWVSYGTGVPNDFFREMVRDPQDSSRLYLATGNNDVVVSIDDGLNWLNLLNIGLGDYTIDDIEIDPTDSSRLLIASFKQGIFESTDAGTSWAPSTAGFVNENVESLALDAASGRIYAGVFGGTSSSADNGASWVHSSGDYDLTSFAIAADPLVADHAYAGSSCCGLYESFDAGLTWARIDLQLPGVAATWVTAIDIPASNPQQLLFSDYNRGLFGTSDGGATWTQLSVGLAPFFTGNVVLEDVDASANNPSVIYVASPDFSRGGVFKSSDGGGTWTRKSGDGIPGPTRTFAVAVHPDNPDIVFAAPTGTLNYSTNGGDTWTTPTTPPGSGIVAIHIDTDRPSLMYAVTGNNNPRFYRSVDGGVNWQQAPSIGVASAANTLTVDPNDRGRVLLGFDNVGYREFTFATDLALTDDNGPQIGEIGQSLTLAATVTVAGPIDANDVLFEQSVPAAFAIVAATATSGSCAIDGQDIRCELGDLSVAAGASVSVTLDPLSDGDYALPASVSSLESDPVLANSSVSFAVSVGAVTDSDGDGIADSVDNCTQASNPSQLDSNGDGYGNACDADLNNDCIVNAGDLGALRVVFFTSDAHADFNGDGIVNAADLGVLRAAFFAPPGPSAGGTCGS